MVIARQTYRHSESLLLFSQLRLLLKVLSLILGCCKEKANSIENLKDMEVMLIDALKTTFDTFSLVSQHLYKANNERF